jgi:hypothetical protein
MAFRIVQEAPGSDFRSRITHAFRLALARDPKPAEIQLMTRYYDQERTHAGESDAWTAVSSALLNLDEFITRE